MFSQPRLTVHAVHTTQWCTCNMTLPQTTCSLWRREMWCSIVPNIYLSLSAGYRTFCFNGKFIRRWNLSEASAQHWSNWLQYFSLIILLNTYIDVGNLVENWYALGICSICLGWKILWSIMQIITFAGIGERKKFNSSFYNVY